MDEVNTDSSLSLVSGKDKKQKTTRKYIRNDLANEVLNSYKTRVLPGEKLMYNNIDILSFACSKMKKTELAKSPLSMYHQRSQC